MAFKVRTTGASDYGRYIKMLVAGNPGAGKTLLASTALNPIYASAEGGLMSIADKGLPYVEIEKIDDLLELKQMLEQDETVRKSIFKRPIDTVVIDTIDEVQRILIRERLKSQKHEAMQMQDWGWLGSQMQAIVSGFRNLPLNVIFNVHLKEISDGESGVVWFAPALQGDIGKQIAGYVDLALLLQSSTVTRVEDNRPVKESVRSLITTQSPQYGWVKDRSGKLPAEIPVNFQDDFQRITDMIYGNLELPESKYTPVTDDTIVKAVAKTNDIEREKVKAEAPKPEQEPETEVRDMFGGEDKKEEVAESFSCEVEGCVEEVTKKQADLSKIRFRVLLCRPHYIEKQKK